MLRSHVYFRVSTVLASVKFLDVFHSTNAVRFYKGQSTAFKWYSAGCRTLEDLRSQKGGVRLSSVQMIGLQYYDGIDFLSLYGSCGS